MRTVIWIFIVAAAVFAQNPPRAIVYVGTDPSGSCIGGSANQQNVTNGHQSYCDATGLNVVGTWALLPSGGGSGTVTSVATNNGLTGGTITTTGTLGLAAIANNAALCNNSGSSAAPTTANCTVTGTGNVVMAISPVLTTPNLGTPSALTLTNATALPIAGITGLGTGVATALAAAVSGSGSICLSSGSACSGGGGSISFPQTVGGTTTSGGIPYFSATTALSSSGLLAANHVLLGGGAGSAPTSDSKLDDGATTSNTLTYTGTGGITASAGPIAASSNGTNAGGMLLTGNTTAPSLSGYSNYFGFIGPNSASFTGYVFQPSATAPSASSLLTAAAVSSNISALTYTALPLSIANGGLNATSAAAGTMPNATSGTAASWTATPTLGASGTLGSLTMGNATSGTLTLEPTTGALGTVTMAIPIPVGNDILSQTISSGTAAMGTSAISSGACASTVTVSATGVATTDVIVYTPSTNPQSSTGYAASASGSLYIWAYPTSGNVNFEVCNNTSGSITPAALTLNWRVAR